ncbi:potassium-transporting ATPase subunit F [Microbacterium protaetiae]|uniref:Potassium-transporting ATPase subunit F n=1 Tax=Microbacterium protaetiae TaxID=2509458 RepID=A0A4P6EUP3_9MICO|nr:potassium-transporting ATPase subunit F [Microbacterium protaetiae]
MRGQTRLVGRKAVPARGEELAHLTAVVHDLDGTRPVRTAGGPASTGHGRHWSAPRGDPDEKSGSGVAASDRACGVWVRYVTGIRRSRSKGTGSAVIVVEVIGAVVGVAAIAYLIIAMIWPERL